MSITKMTVLELIVRAAKNGSLDESILRNLTRSEMEEFRYLLTMERERRGLYKPPQWKPPDPPVPDR